VHIRELLCECRTVLIVTITAQRPYNICDNEDGSKQVVGLYNLSDEAD